MFCKINVHNPVTTPKRVDVTIPTARSGRGTSARTSTGFLFFPALFSLYLTYPPFYIFFGAFFVSTTHTPPPPLSQINPNINLFVVPFQPPPSPYLTTQIIKLTNFSITPLQTTPPFFFLSVNRNLRLPSHENRTQDPYITS